MFLSQGGVGAPDWRARQLRVHAAFVARRLSPGGCADLLAMTLFVDALEREGCFPMIDVLLNALVPIFAVMALGYFAGWIRDVDNHHVAELNALVMDFALPASLFVATASTSRSLLLAQWPLLLVFIVSMLALYCVVLLDAAPSVRLGIERSVGADHHIRRPTMRRGLPLITAVFGASDTIYVALSIVVGSIVPSPLTLAILEANRRRRADREISARSCRPSAAPCVNRSCSCRSSEWCSPCSKFISRRLSAVPSS